MSGEGFFKMSGSGNDFVFLDARWTSLAAWPPERIARVCARHTGVGADGLVLLGPRSEQGTVRFVYFNADGSRGAMCGNAALCATRLAVRLELSSGEDVRLDTDAGVVRGRWEPDHEDRAELVLPDVTDVRAPTIPPGPGERQVSFATVGVPHLVVLVDDLEAVDVTGRGRELRFHQAIGAGGANVNFVSRIGSTWGMRTYERGVEDETLACGTGAVACGLVLGSSGMVALPWQVRSRAGSTLEVSGVLEPGMALRGPRLSGEARIVFRGVLGPGY
jgi:diaminopimelate epimerase